MQSTLEEKPKSKPSLRARADRIKAFTCKNLIAVIEHPDDIQNIGTIIRNVNALGVEKAYVVTDRMLLPDEWRDMRTKSKLSAISASAIKWSFVRKFKDTDSCIDHLDKKGFASIVTSPLNLGTASGIVLYEITKQRRAFQADFDKKIAARKARGLKDK